MCGVIGYTGDEQALPVLRTGLENLEYRGYDSVGVALRNGSKSLRLFKQAGRIKDFSLPDDDSSTVGVGHTRWSTHGEPTDANAHPHTDCTGTVAVVHNGIIENYDSLREEPSDHTFTSETDTEVVPHLVEEYLEEGLSLPEAVDKILERLEGTFALGVVSSDFDGLVAARQDSPLVICHGEARSFIASDVTAFLKHTRDVTYVEDGDVAVLSGTDVEIRNDGELVDRPTERVEYLNSLEEITFVACGTFYHAGMYAAQLVESLADVRASAEVAREYEFDGGRDPWRTLVIPVTQSGETADTLSALRRAKRAGARSLAVTNTLGSTITREADDTVFIRAGPEIGVAATKTFVSQVATLALFTVSLARARDEMTTTEAIDFLGNIRQLPGAVQRVLDEEQQFKDAAEEYVDGEAFFFIGRKLGYPVALEGALKLKEIAYVHAEGFAAGELKHGPLALVTPNSPVLAVLSQGSAPEATLNNVNEVESRGAPLLGCTSTEDAKKFLDMTFDVPELGALSPLIVNVCFQLFAYHVANFMARSIDKPRNLAKSVTVD